MDKRVSLILGLLLIAVLVVVGFSLKAAKNIENNEAKVYSVATEANETGENFSAMVHYRDELLPTDIESITYDIANDIAPFYSLSFPYHGWDCKDVSYLISQKDGVLIVDQHQEKGDCKKAQDYFITSLMTYRGEFTKIRVNLFVDETLQNFFEFPIDPNQPVWPVQPVITQ